MKTLLYVGAVAGALAAIMGAAAHDPFTVAIGLLAGIADYWMAENYEKTGG